MYIFVQKNHSVWNDHSIFTSDKTISFESLYGKILKYIFKKNGKDYVLKRTSNKIPESS